MLARQLADRVRRRRRRRSSRRAPRRPRVRRRPRPPPDRRRPRPRAPAADARATADPPRPRPRRPPPPPISEFPQSWTGTWQDPVTGGSGSLELTLTGKDAEFGGSITMDGTACLSRRDPGGAYDGRDIGFVVTQRGVQMRFAGGATDRRSPGRSRPTATRWTGHGASQRSWSLSARALTLGPAHCYDAGTAVSTLAYRVLTSAGERAWRVETAAPSAPWTSALKRSFGPSSRNTSRPHSRSAARRSSSATASACPVRPSGASSRSSRRPGC